MIGSLLFFTLPLASPFSAPFRIPTHHTYQSSTHTSIISYGSSSRSTSHIIDRNTIHIFGERRRHFTLLASKSDDDDDKDTSNDNDKSSMPPDEILFSNTDDEDNDLTISDSTLIYGEVDDEDDDVDITEDDPYAQTAPSEFQEGDNNVNSATTMQSLTRGTTRELNTTPLDWGGALSTLRSRVSDVESGKSTNPSTALFRTISRERPNEAIGRFVREANPEVVAAMTGAVGSLLGSLSNPAMGVETIVSASSEKLGNLCFQLQMTGYMFRNAEYVLALKSLMNIRGEGATLDEYKAAFQRIDTDGSGYLEIEEIEALLTEVYDETPPSFEVTTFLEFFDSNNDGRISWEEFERGFGVVTSMSGNEENKPKMNGFSLPASTDDDEDEIGDFFGEPAISGTIEVELEDGKVIEVDAQEYVDDLKKQALALKRELAKEKGIDPKEMGISDAGDNNLNGLPGAPDVGSSGSIASYIASLQGDVKSLTEGISPEVVESMKMLIEFVLEGGEGGSKKAMDKDKEMELPGSALQQLALWQLVIGYRLRETEATGEWKRMIE